MRSFTAKLRLEIERLEAELARDTRRERLEALKKTLQHYEGRRHTPKMRGEPTKGSVIHNKVVQMLRNDGPLHRGKILEALTRDNLMSGSERDMDYLASRLSMWNDVSTDGKGNWRVAD